MPFDGPKSNVGNIKVLRRFSRRGPGIPVFARKVPRTLSDDLRWRCSSCQTLVPTKETHFHLISCILKLVNTTHVHSSREQIIESNTTVCHSMDSRPFNRVSSERSTRPRTKRLERPTPNIKHPVIDVKAVVATLKAKKRPDVKVSLINGNKVNKASNECPVKSKSFESKVPSRGASNDSLEPQPAIKCKSLVLLSNNSTGKEVTEPCKACQRTDAPERFHSHSLVADKMAKILSKSKLTNKAAPKATDANRSLAGKPASTGLQAKGCVCDKSVEERFLSAHDPKCSETWKREKDKLSTTQRKAQLQKRPEPPKAGGDGTKTGCDPAGWDHFKAQLVPCLKCGRTFFPHRLSIHEKGCSDTSEGSIETKKRTSPPAKVKSGPKKKDGTEKVLIASCKHCSRRLSPSSLSSHLLECNPCPDKIAKDHNQDEQQKKEEEPESEVDIEWQNHLQQLKPCSKCKRTFFPERLEKHEPNCKADPVTEGSI